MEVVYHAVSAFGVGVFPEFFGAFGVDACHKVYDDVVAESGVVALRFGFVFFFETVDEVFVFGVVVVEVGVGEKMVVEALQLVVVDIFVFGCPVGYGYQSGGVLFYGEHSVEYEARLGFVFVFVLVVDVDYNIVVGTVFEHIGEFSVGAPVEDGVFYLVLVFQLCLEFVEEFFFEFAVGVYYVQVWR